MKLCKIGLNCYLAMSCKLFNNENVVVFIVGESPEELDVSRVFSEPIQTFLFKFSGLFPSS